MHQPQPVNADVKCGSWSLRRSYRYDTEKGGALQELAEVCLSSWVGMVGFLGLYYHLKVW